LERTAMNRLGSDTRISTNHKKSRQQGTEYYTPPIGTPSQSDSEQTHTKA